MRVFSIVCVYLSLLIAPAQAYSNEQVNANQAQDTEAQVTETIKVTLLADIEYRPYSYIENDLPKGLLVEIVQAIDQHIEKYDIDIKNVRWSKGIQQLEKGSALGLIGAYFRAHNRPLIYPYSYPIHFEQVVTVCNGNVFKNTGAQWPKDYAGLIVGNVAGYDGWTTNDVRSQNITTMNFFEFPTATLALQGVYREVVNCTIFEEATFHQTLQYLIDKGKISQQNTLKIVSEMSLNSVHLAYSQKAFESADFAYAQDFKKAFDIALVALLSSGELQPIFKKYGVEYH